MTEERSTMEGRFAVFAAIVVLAAGLGLIGLVVGAVMLVHHLLG